MSLYTKRNQKIWYSCVHWTKSNQVNSLWSSRGASSIAQITMLVVTILASVTVRCRTARDFSFAIVLICFLPYASLLGMDGNGAAPHRGVPSHPHPYLANGDTFLPVPIPIGFGAGIGFAIKKPHQKQIVIFS